MTAPYRKDRGVFPSDVQAVVDDFLPLCKALVEGRYAVSIGGSLGRRTSDQLSDIDFRLFCDALLPDADRRAHLQEQVDLTVRRWGERGTIVDGVWIRTIREVGAELDRWCRGVIAPEQKVWTIWGYQLLSDVHHQVVVDDPFGVIAAWKEQLRDYPPPLKQALLEKHLASVRYWRDDYHYRHKVQRQDLVFLASLTTRLVHDLIQILFALNETYYVGDGYNLTVVRRLAHVPDDFVAAVEEVLYPRRGDAMLARQRDTLIHLIDEVELLVARLGAVG